MRSIQQILDALNAAGIQTNPIPHMSYGITHSLHKDVFENTIKNVLLHFPIKAQNPDWYPGNPDSSDPSCYGFYICPIDGDEWLLSNQRSWLGHISYTFLLSNFV